MEERRWVDYIPAYLGWAVVAALGVWLMLISRNSFLGVLSAVYVRDSIQRAWQVRFLDKVYFIAVGMLWTIVAVITEAYFRRGAGRPGLGQRIAKVVGIELLLIFGADLLLLILQGFNVGMWQRWLIVLGELALGIAATVFARRPVANTNT
ncbi:MAG: hypothetical protein J7M39_00190 [Anaerolineae bacterium]|nr:hypothetical protein [Anaerolineae bacterium]